jgi:xylulokinase
VYAAAGDQPCGSLGAGVAEPGQLGVNGGTSCSNELLVDQLPDRSRADYFIEISPTGRYIVENDIPSGGSAVMRWYRERFGHADLAEAEKSGRDPWDVIYDALGVTEPGNRGFMIVPYLQGVYGPYWDQNARAVALGIQSDHTRHHLVRGLLEGVAYESRREVELMTSTTGLKVTEIRMYGGSARSGAWNQLFADMFNVQVSVPSTPESTALGAAMCAAVGSGIRKDFVSAAESMVTIRAIYTPDADRAALYHRYYTEVYRELYDAVIGIVGRATRISSESLSGEQR